MLHKTAVALALLAACLTTRADEPQSPLSTRDALKSFRLANPELTIELIAAEPDVIDPVACAWDADGRLYVVEMHDYPVGPPSGRIKQLVDRDGDGRYEQVTVFAEGLAFPNGVLRGGTESWSRPRPIFCFWATAMATAAPMNGEPC